MNNQFKLSPVAIGVMTTICCGIANGTENKPEIVTVIGTTVTLTKEEIELLPKDNPTLSELLKNQPRIGVDDAQTSMQGGDLKPEKISIAGARPHQTKYTLNGININNSATFATDGNAANELASGHTSGYFIDTNLLESVEVLDHNISAEEGGFTGGVIAAELRKPSEEFVIDYNYRMNDSAWNAEQKVGDNFVDSYATPIDGSGKYQPDFQKRMHAMHISGAISDNQKLALNVSKQTSEIPLFNGKDVDQQMDNVFLTHVWQRNNWQTKTDIRFAEHQSHNFANDSLQDDKPTALSETVNSHSGVGASFELEGQFDGFALLNSISYDQLEDNRDADTDYLVGVTQYKDGQIKKYNVGSYGNLSQTQKQWQFKTAAYLEPISIGSTEHNIKFGLEYATGTAERYRPNEILIYSYKEDPIKETYLPALNRFAADQLDVETKQYGAFFENHLTWDRFSFNLGARVDHLDTFDSTVFSPRLMASMVAHEASNSIFTVGANRYYSNDVLAIALKAKDNKNMSSFNNCKVVDGNWSNLEPDNLDCFKSTYKSEIELENADVPYSDEFSLGLQSELGNYAVGITYINRLQKDGLSYSAGSLKSPASVKNNIESENHIYSFEVGTITPYDVVLGELGLFWSISYNQREGSGDLKGEYDQGGDPSAGFQDEWVMIDGELVRYSEMNISGYQTPIKSSFDILMSWHELGLVWNNRLNYNKGKNATTYNKMEKVIIDGEELRVNSLSTVKLDDLFTWDTSLNWTPTQFDDHVSFGLSVTNILDEQTVISVSGFQTATKSPNEYYNSGRQIWLNVSLRN